jgi:hypothetical protein
MSQFSSHSADVAMWLDCGHYGRMDLSRITPKSVVAKQPRDIPPCYADLVVTVDGKRFLRRVHVASGFAKGRALARVEHFEEPPF